jgi:pSer/pThr/pTyr-binding forkhead associated (FHA) protein
MQPSGMAVLLTQPDMVIGRHSESDVRLPLPDVSRKHCRFLFADGSWQVVDLDSLNGVFVNGVRVCRMLLHHGDMVRIASFVFEVQLPGHGNSKPLGTHDIESSLEPLPLPRQDDIRQQRKAS